MACKNTTPANPIYFSRHLFWGLSLMDGGCDKTGHLNKSWWCACVCVVWCRWSLATTCWNLFPKSIFQRNDYSRTRNCGLCCFCLNLS